MEINGLEMDISNKFKKILYVSSVDISLPEGPSVNEREFCWGLYQIFGERVQFILPKPEKKVDELSKYQILHVRRCDNRNPYKFILHQIDLSKKLCNIINIYNFDLIFTRLGLIPIGLWFGFRGKNHPLFIKHLTGIVDLYNINDSAVVQYLKKAIGMMQVEITKRLLKKAIAADTPTQAHLQRIKNTYKVSSELVLQIENATNTARFQPMDINEAKIQCRLQKFNPIIGYVGGRPWERGGNEMISVAPELLKQFPKLGFVIIGGGEGMANLLERIEKSGLSSSFYCPGVIDYEDIPLYINSFNVGIAFDRPDRFKLVGNSNQKVRQYISCGKPVVVTKGGNEFIDSNNLGSIVNTENLSEVVNAIKYWISLNKFKQEQHSQKAISFACANFSIEKAIIQRIAFFDKRLSLISGGVNQ